jgi:hypothetical protein
MFVYGQVLGVRKRPVEVDGQVVVLNREKF